MDLKNKRLIYLKAVLFLLIGLYSSALLIIENFNLQTVLLLVLTVWAFCRAYYFAFYVIEKYVDSSYKFSGLISFAAYLIKRVHGAKTLNG